MDVDEGADLESQNATAVNADAPISGGDETTSMQLEEYDDLLSVDGMVEAVTELASNPYQYELHLKYIKTCKALSLLDELHAAREAFATTYPLSEDIWLEWLRDERLLASTIEEKRAVINLYLRAVNDYLSIELWREYIDFVVEEYKNGLAVSAEDPDALWLTLEQVRRVCAQALTHTSDHVSKSHIVWNAMRDFEVHVLETSQSRDQEGHVRNMYRERLKVPHSAIQDTFNDYSSFETKYDNARYEARLQSASALYSATQKILQKLDQFEMKLNQTNESVDTYRLYLEQEMSTKDKTRVRTLYERALVKHCLDASLWDEYLTFLFVHSKIAIITLSVAERAVRNCSWCGDLWAHYVRILEELQKPKEEVKGAVERGLVMVAAASSLEETYKVCDAFCRYEARQITDDDIPGSENAVASMRRTFNEAIKHLKEKFPPGDPYLRLEKGRIQAELYILKEPLRARKLYEEYTKKHASCSEIWNEFAHFEREHGTPTAVREVFKNAIAKQLDWPDRIIQAWLQYEREFGTVSSYYEAYFRIKQSLAMARKRQTKAVTNAYDADQQAFVQQTAQPPLQMQQLRPSPALQARQQPKTEFGDQSSKRKDRGDTQQQLDSKPSAKRAKSGKNDAPIGQAERKAVNMDVTEATINERRIPDEDYKIIDNSFGDFTIYVVGHYEEAVIRDTFEDCGFITDVRTDDEGVFVEFRDVDSARSAFKLNGILVSEAPIVLKPCRPENRTWEFSNDRNPSTVYVSHLPVGVTKQWLREKFQHFGGIREVRLRDKKTVAFAYVEFTEPESATKSLVLDNTIVREGLPLMRVAISNPRAKDQKREEQLELFISNLPKSWNEDQVKGLFKDYEGLQNVRIVMDHKTNQPRGIAFAAFGTSEHAKEALKVNSTMADRRVITVSLADPNFKRHQDNIQNKQETRYPNGTGNNQDDSRNDSISANRGFRGGSRGGGGRGQSAPRSGNHDGNDGTRNKPRGGRGVHLAVEPRKESTADDTKAPTADAAVVHAPKVMEKMSRGGTEKVLAKLQKSVEDGNYYEAHQMYLSVTQRYLKQNAPEVAIALLHSGAKNLLVKAQVGSAADLASRLIELFQSEGMEVNEFTRSKILDLTQDFPVHDSLFKEFVRESLAWSAKMGSTPTGDQQLRHVFAAKYYAAMEYYDAEAHFAYGTFDSARIMGMMMWEWSEEGTYSERGYFILRAVLEYLALKKVGHASIALEAFVKAWNSNNSSDIAETLPLKTPSGSDVEVTIYKSPMTNFAQFVLLLVQRSAGDQFNSLRSQYRPVWEVDPYLSRLLDRVADVYFGLGPKKQPNLMEDLMKTLFAAPTPTTTAGTASQSPSGGVSNRIAELD
ncbi:hypothetical protein SeLEV6574_g01964 [Synchytrium endobioticum]|uniref:RRM domain-containing protein n=1 Tax=Synchytrium endobioticum TaxID=286115 RepID=A0A507DAZ0_9FUNG|nr:hypothetical protein SeLEV6574_g01964 [Synchytrium endobioticum]